MRDFVALAVGSLNGPTPVTTQLTFFSVSPFVISSVLLPDESLSLPIGIFSTQGHSVILLSSCLAVTVGAAFSSFHHFIITIAVSFLRHTLYKVSYHFR